MPSTLLGPPPPDAGHESHAPSPRAEGGGNLNTSAVACQVARRRTTFVVRGIRVILRARLRGDDRRVAQAVEAMRRAIDPAAPVAAAVRALSTAPRRALADRPSTSAQSPPRYRPVLPA